MIKSPIQNIKIEHRSNRKKRYCQICDVYVKANSESSHFQSTISSIKRNKYGASNERIDKFYEVTLTNIETIIFIVEEQLDVVFLWLPQK